MELLPATRPVRDVGKRRRFRAAAWLTLALAHGGILLLAACEAAEKPQPPSSAPNVDPSTTPVVTPSSPEADPPLVVNDAAAANPDLVAAPLQVPAGFNVAAHTLRLPPGFRISVLAAGLSRPRFMAVDSAGNLLVADQGSGNVYRYPAEDGAIKPQAKPPAPLLTGLDGPSSLAFHDGYVYVGESTQVSRYAYKPGGAAGKAEVIVPKLPTGFHVTKTVAFGPDGKLYVSIGSSCNICEEDDERRAAISRYNPDGSGFKRFAWGLRNAVGLAFQPGTGALWATVNERDQQGDEIPPDLVTIVREGANYGWPDCQPPNAKPQSSGAKCEGVTPPTLGIQPHSAPLGLTWVEGLRFPEAYQNSLYVAQHGSWNREPPAAPKLLHIALDGSKPTKVRDFATGWQDAKGERWGRPVGMLPAPDGSLIVSDDAAGLLYRITATP